MSDKNKGKGKKKAASKAETTTVIFANLEKNPGQHPRNVYREWVYQEDGSVKEHIWCSCEDGSEMGREAITERNQFTQIPELKGYNYTIPYNAENKEKLIKAATARTQFYHKDKAATTTVAKEEF